MMWNGQSLWLKDPDPHVLHIAPVKANGRTWTGDPHDYEQACDRKFVFSNDAIQSFDGFPPGGDLDDISGPNKHTYYDWLRSDAKRWGAFNSWLLDPAIIKAAADPGQSATDLVRDGDVGDTSGCADASAKVAQQLAKN